MMVMIPILITATVRLPEENRNSVGTIGNILVSADGGPNIPLSQLAKIALTEGPVQISREDGLRRIGIELNIEGRDIGGFVAEAKRKIAESVKLPPGYDITWGGQFENQQGSSPPSKRPSKDFDKGRPVSLGENLDNLSAPKNSLSVIMIGVLSDFVERERCIHPVLSGNHRSTCEYKTKVHRVSLNCIPSPLEQK
jgi:hypothetical protein